MTQKLELLNKDFKAAIIKKIIMNTLETNDNLSKELEDIKKELNGILKLKNTAVFKKWMSRLNTK